MSPETIKLVRDKNMERKIREFIQDNKDQLLQFLQWQYRISRFYGKSFFNEQKFCLSTDIVDDRNVGYHKGSYYDTYLTNQICGKQLRSNKDDTIITDATWFFPITTKNDGRLIFKDITKSSLNNEVGISTIAITNDNYLVIWAQNRLAQSSSGMLVPTGSGSCDWDDVVDDNLNKTIIKAMNRELWEENG